MATKGVDFGELFKVVEFFIKNVDKFEDLRLKEIVEKLVMAEDGKNFAD